MLESHTIPGGCAHSFHKNGFEFDSGPSFFAGIEPESKSNNALKQILDLVGEQVECVQYGGWTAYLPEGVFKCENNEQAYLAEVSLLKKSMPSLCLFVFWGGWLKTNVQEFSLFLCPCIDNARS